MDIRLFVQLTDGRGRHLAAPQGFGNILYTSDRYTGHVHLNKSFFYTVFPTVIPLYNGGLKGDAFELGNFQGDLPGSSGEAPAVMTAAITLVLLIALTGSFVSVSLPQLPAVHSEFFLRCRAPVLGVNS